MDRALSDSCGPECNARRAWREFRSAAWPSHLRSLVGLLAKGAEQSDGGSPQCGNKIYRDHCPESLEWGPFEGLGQDIVAGVRRIKSEAGPDLVLSGSSTLTSTLLEHGLADEVLLIVYPVLFGTGKRFFAEGTPARSFEFDGTKAMPSGVILSTYKVAGPLKTG
jgi:dihydrofolate reductase